MQLKIQRSQREGGISGSTIIFCLDVRAAYTEEERANIEKYRIGKEIIYSSQAAQRHAANMSAQLDRIESRSLSEKASGLARGAVSLALAKLNLNISIASLGRGHHIECKDLEELLQAEETIKEAGRKVTGYLAAAATFNGSEILIDYANGEQMEVRENAQALFALAAPGTTSQPPALLAPPTAEAPLSDHVMHWLEQPRHIKWLAWGVGGFLFLIMLSRCYGG